MLHECSLPPFVNVAIEKFVICQKCICSILLRSKFINNQDDDDPPSSNFSTIGQIGKKFDVFAKMAFKSMALWPLKVMDQFFDPLLVLLQVL